MKRYILFPLVLLGAAWCVAGCSVIRQRTSAAVGDTNYTATAWCLSLWEGRTVVEKMRLSAGPRFVAVGVEAQEAAATSTNVVPTLEALARLLQSIPLP